MDRDAIEGDIVRQVRGVLMAQYQTAVTENVSVTWVNRDVSLPLGDITAVKVMTDDRSLLGMGSIPVYFNDEKRTIMIDTAVKKSFVRLTKTLEAGHVIDASDVELVTLPVDQVSALAIDSFTAVIGRKVVTRLLTGSVLTTRMVMMPRAVDLGDAIQLIVIDGDVQLQLDGYALGSGRVGDRISVRSQLYQAPLKGEIVEDNVVEIRL